MNYRETMAERILNLYRINRKVQESEPKHGEYCYCADCMRRWSGTHLVIVDRDYTIKTVARS